MIVVNYSSNSRESSPMLHPSASLRPRMLKRDSPLKPTSRTPKAAQSFLNRYSSSPRFHSRPTSASSLPPDTSHTPGRHQHEQIHFSPHIGVNLTVSLQRLHQKRKQRVEKLLRSQQTTPRRACDARSMKERLNVTPSPRPTDQWLLHTPKTLIAGNLSREKPLGCAATGGIATPPEKSRVLGKPDFDNLLLIQRLEKETRNRQSVRVKSSANSLRKLATKASPKLLLGQELVAGVGLTLHKPLKRHLLRT